jgi:AraC-like DNA-binding protein
MMMAMSIETEDNFSVLAKAVRNMRHIHIVDRTHDRIIIKTDAGQGLVTVRQYALYPGIFLGFYDVETSSFPSFKGVITDGFKINFCADGRCEVKMSDDRYLFLEPGDISFSNITISDDFSLPYDRYHGIELHIYDPALKQVSLPMFDSFNINLECIYKKYCPTPGSFIARAEEKIKSVFLSLNNLPPGCESDYLRLKVTELLFLLTHMEKLEEKESRTFFTLGQIKIAKQIMKVITADLSKHHQVNELAKQFAISPTSLKKYFQGVYGQNISEYLRNKRMDKAAEYLVKSKHQISDIAFMAGYENASKFSAIFKAVKGETPLEYRRIYKTILDN